MKPKQLLLTLLALLGSMAANADGFEIEDLSELSNNRQYLIHTRDKIRGTLGVIDNHLASTNPTVTGPYDCRPVVLDTDNPLITNTRQLSSPYTESSEGSLAAMIDGNPNTFWHSTWSDGDVEAGTHYFQVEMVSQADIDVAFQVTRRKTNDNHITEWGVYGTNNANASKTNCTLLAVIKTPYNNWGETRVSDIFSTGGYQYLRFYINDTSTPHGFGHLAEFQLYPATFDETRDASPFAIIQKNDGYYLYSVRDKAFITPVNDGDENVSPLCPNDNKMNIYKRDNHFVFDFVETGYTINVNFDPGIAICDYGTLNGTFDDGNLFLIEEVGNFDPTEALAKFATQVTVTYKVMYEGDEVATATKEVVSGSALPPVPASLDNGFVTLTKTGTHPTTVTEDVTVTYNATWNGPFVFTKTLSGAKWYNMNIRSGYYVGKQESEPYYPTWGVDEATLATPAYQWAFGGDPYHVKIYNRTTALNETLTKDGDNAVMRSDDYSWDPLPNNGGFVLRVQGTDYCCINQFGSTSGPLQFWTSSKALTDDGSTFRVEEVVETSPGIEFADANVKALCVDNWDTNGDGELSEAEAAAVTSLGNVFYNKTNITSFNELQYFTGLTSIAGYAFYGCNSLTSITIQNSVTSIGNTAFSGCSSLTSITIPNSVTNIGEYAFNNCRSLTSITIPNSVTSIGDGAFGGCSGLTAITIPNSVTSIGRSAFYNCSGLTSITIPESVIYIGDSAFRGCYFKTEFFVNNSSLTTDNNWGATLYDEETSDGLLIKNNIVVKCREWAVSVSIPSGVTGIGSSAFYNCTSLTSITIPNSVTSIGYGAFRSCSSLTSITIPNSVTSIDDYAFKDCSGLTSITIPNSVTSMGDDAFSNTAWYYNQPNGLVYAGKFAYSYKGTMPQGTEIVIKDGTLGIIGSAFSGCSGLTSVTIPNSVTSIGRSAFYSCSGLTSVTITNSVKSIGNWAFQYCSSLTSVNILKGVKEIGNEAFKGCSSLSTIVIPKGVTNIGSYAFENCTGLESVTILEGGDVIGQSVFQGCNSLKSVTVNEGVTFLGYKAFSECNNVTIKLPNSLREIGGQLFGNNSTGNTIIIGNGIKNVNDAFIYSSNLTIYIYALQRPSSLYHNFYMTNNCKTYVPYGCSGFYRSGANIEGGSYWSGEIIEMPYPSLSIDNSRVATYCSEKAMDFSELANVKAYVATGFSPSTQTLLLTRVMQVPAREGVIVFGEPGTYDVPECETDMVFCNMLKGLVLPQKLSPVDNDDRKVFTLTSGEEGTGFYPLDDQQWYAAGTAYLQLPENAITSDVKQIRLEIEESISTEVGKTTLNSDSKVGIIYGINGQRRASVNKGINILRMSDGTTRKVLIK